MNTGIYKGKTGVLVSPQYFFGIRLGGRSPGTGNEVPKRPAKQNSYGNSKLIQLPVYFAMFRKRGSRAPAV
jgi:hypothetical protein